MRASSMVGPRYASRRPMMGLQKTIGIRAAVEVNSEKRRHESVGVSRVASSIRAAVATITANRRCESVMVSQKAIGIRAAVEVNSGNGGTNQYGCPE